MSWSKRYNAIEKLQLALQQYNYASQTSCYSDAAAKHMTDKDRAEYDRVIKEFNQKRQDNALVLIYAAAKYFVDA